MDFFDILAHRRMFLNDFFFTTVGVVKITNLSWNSSPCFCLRMALVSSFHVVERMLDVPQHSIDLRKEIQGFLQRLDLDTKNPQLFFLGLVTVFDSLFTSWAMQVPLWLRFLAI